MLIGDVAVPQRVQPFMVDAQVLSQSGLVFQGGCALVTADRVRALCFDLLVNIFRKVGKQMLSNLRDTENKVIAFLKLTFTLSC